MEGPNARDQIAFCAFHSFLVEVQTNSGDIRATYVRNNPEIRIAGGLLLSPEMQLRVRLSDRTTE